MELGVGAQEGRPRQQFGWLCQEMRARSLMECVLECCIQAWKDPFQRGLVSPRSRVPVLCPSPALGMVPLLQKNFVDSCSMHQMPEVLWETIQGKQRCPGICPQNHPALSTNPTRKLGKGLRLEQRRLGGDLVALHKSLTGGGSRGGRALLPGNRARRRGNGLRLGQGRLRVGSSRNFPMERVLRPWQGLPSELWSAHPWRCPRNSWRWHSGLWAGDKVGMRRSLDSMVWELFSSLCDSVCSHLLPRLCCRLQSQLCHLREEPRAAAGADKTRNNIKTVETLHLRPAAAHSGNGTGTESAWIQVMSCILWGLIICSGCKVVLDLCSSQALWCLNTSGAGGAGTATGQWVYQEKLLISAWPGLGLPQSTAEACGKCFK